MKDWRGQDARMYDRVICLAEIKVRLVSGRVIKITEDGIIVEPEEMSMQEDKELPYQIIVTDPERLIVLRP